MRTIALEEHYATGAFMEGPGRELKAQAEAARDHPGGGGFREAHRGAVRPGGG